jgi:hypothetical protein
MSYIAKCRQWIVALLVPQILTVPLKRDLNFPFLLREKLEISLLTSGLDIAYAIYRLSSHKHYTVQHN